MRKFIVLLSALLALTLAVPAAAQESNIAEVAAADGRFSTLVAALEAADLVDTIATGGPFTVFAPTDAAFAALPAGTVEALLADPAALANILTYHVVRGERDAAALSNLSSIRTLQGSRISLAAGDGLTLNGGVNVIIADVPASNGIIHAIDAVLLPPTTTAAARGTVTRSSGSAPGTIVDIAVNNGDFDTLVAALGAAGLVETLSGPGPFTVFAPTDAAFAALPDGTVEALLADIPTLTDILTYHVVPGRVPASAVIGLDGQSATTVQGSPISIDIVDGGVVLNGNVNVIVTDIRATNGIIHVIDAVLLP